jgi:hypothetical protein
MSTAIEKSRKAFNASVLNTSLFLWLNTITQHQYKNGKNFKMTVNELYKNGGISRFYNGFIPTVINTSCNRFIDYLTHEMTQVDDLLSKVFIGGVFASVFKIFIAPLETYKIMNQIHGKKAVKLIKLRIKNNGIKSLWKGSGDIALSNFVEHVGWFNTYEYFDRNLPKDMNIILRSGFLGLSSSVTTDIMSNHLKIIKTMKQTTDLCYNDIVREIIRKNGVHGLFFRGLGTKLMTNSLYGITFSLLFSTLKNN